MSDSSRRLLRTRLVDTPAAADMAFDSITVDGYGYGWFTGTINGRPSYFHTGGNAGFRTFNAIVPERDLSFVVLSNDEGCDIRPAVADLLAAIR